MAWSVALIAVHKVPTLKRLNRWYGNDHKQKFSAKVGTIFEDSPIPLEKWLPAVWMLVNCKNGISSYEIHRALGVTQKSAWFMMHRIRLAMQNNLSEVGRSWQGKSKPTKPSSVAGSLYAPTERRARMITAIGVKDKAAAFGILERGGEVRVLAVPNRKKKRCKATSPNTSRKASDLHRCAHVLHGTERKIPA